MKASELEDLEWLHGLWANPDKSFDPARFGEVMAALPALIAKVRAAEGVAESLEAVLSEYDTGPFAAQARLELEGYRKAGES